jgi:hypothetical protein
MIFFFGVHTTSYVLKSSFVILIHALVNHSSNVSSGLFPILHPPLHTNFTFQYLHNPYGMRSIDVLILVAFSIVKSKKSFDFSLASWKISSNTCKSNISGLLVKCTGSSSRKFAATIGNVAFLLAQIFTSHLNHFEYEI